MAGTTGVAVSSFTESRVIRSGKGEWLVGISKCAAGGGVEHRTAFCKNSEDFTHRWNLKSCLMMETWTNRGRDFVEVLKMRRIERLRMLECHRAPIRLRRHGAEPVLEANGSVDREGGVERVNAGDSQDRSVSGSSHNDNEIGRLQDGTEIGSSQNGTEIGSPQNGIETGSSQNGTENGGGRTKMDIRTEDKVTSSGSGQVKVQSKEKGTVPGGGAKWSMLLSSTALDDAHVSRASSVADAHVLRRKGRLKEQDGLIQFIISMHMTHSPFQVMEKMERWVEEHYGDHKRSTLRRLVPGIGRFYTPLPLVQALEEYDYFASLSRRRYVPPNFAEIRHVLNIAQVHAIAGQISLLTFDADGTLYADGHHIQRDSKMIDIIIKIIQEGINVAIVTAAGYPDDAARYEDRFAGLLSAFRDRQLLPKIIKHFHVMGGECNYLLRVRSDYHLEFVPEAEWKTSDMLEWSDEDVSKLLDEAEDALVSAASRLRLPVHLVRKPLAVGVIPKESTIYEVLEELALTVQMRLIDSKMPFCAFNGGNDVFVDVGNKSIGLEALMKFLRKRPQETMHVGDRFTVSGNDSATRSKCCILWVANPEETGFFTRILLRQVQLTRPMGRQF